MRDSLLRPPFPRHHVIILRLGDSAKYVTESRLKQASSPQLPSNQKQLFRRIFWRFANVDQITMMQVKIDQFVIFESKKTSKPGPRLRNSIHVFQTILKPHSFSEINARVATDVISAHHQEMTSESTIPSSEGPWGEHPRAHGTKKARPFMR
jgi:hypothetical protein